MNRLSIPILLILSATLLVGARFGFVWAGGDGYVPNLSVRAQASAGAQVDRAGQLRAVQGSAELVRGETLITDAGERALLEIGEVHVAIDERTSVTLERIKPDGIVLRLGRGRLLAVASPEIEEIVVLANQIETGLIDGAVSIVHYDFQSSVQIAPLETAVYVLTDEAATVTSTPVYVTYTEPLSIEDSTFDPDGENVSDFYSWAEAATGFTINR